MESPFYGLMVNYYQYLMSIMAAGCVNDNSTGNSSLRVVVWQCKSIVL